MESLSDHTMRELYRGLLRVRLAEEAIVSHYGEQEMKCPTHLSIGQEAAAVGVGAALRKEDLALSTHRCHAHYLAKGGALKPMFAELYGKATGCAKGKGGSMHLIDAENGFLGASAVLGGTISMGAGLAWALKLKNQDNVSVAFMGDAATEEGVFHETLNFSALHKLPVLFVSENNFYATQTHISVRQAHAGIWRQGETYGIRGERLDGRDVLGVHRAALRAVEECRAGKGPVLLEIVAYRWKEHVGPKFDYDLGYRSKEELDRWMADCPVKKLKDKLLSEGILTEEAAGKMRKEQQQEIDEAIAFAKASPFPAPEELMEDVYA